MTIPIIVALKVCIPVMTEQTPPDIVPVNVLFFIICEPHYVVRFVMYRYKQIHTTLCAYVRYSPLPEEEFSISTI